MLRRGARETTNGARLVLAPFIPLYWLRTRRLAPRCRHMVCGPFVRYRAVSLFGAGSIDYPGLSQSLPASDALHWNEPLWEKVPREPLVAVKDPRSPSRLLQMEALPLCRPTRCWCRFRLAGRQIAT